MSVVLACDLGGTSFRAALVDAQGRTRAESVIIGPTLIDRMGWSEVDAEAWWTILCEAAAKLAEAEPELFGAVEGIAICGVTRTQVFLGRDGRQLRPAITWKDTRSEAAAARLRDRLADHPEAERINAFHPLARLAWLAEEEEASFRALASVLEPKDWLNFRLTGRQAGDPVSMARLMACTEVAGDGDALSAIGLNAAIIPQVLEPCAVLGPVQPGLPGALGRLAGVPVFCSSSDTWVAVTGLGAMRPGFAYNISGTTEVLGVVGERAAATEGLLTVDWRGLWQLGGPSQNGADTAAWLVSLLGGTERGFADVGDGIGKLLAGRRHPQPLVFLPYLQGERVPYWNPALRGAFLGLGRQHGATDLAFAVLEGVACLNRIVLERAEAALGAPVGEIRFGGGAASNPVWAQIKADLSNRPVVVGAAKEPGLLGAAIIAWTGLGRFPSLAAAQEALVTPARRYEPDPARRGAYDALFAVFRRAEAALAPISADLAGLSRSAGSLPGVHATPSSP
ncbi:FGGY-family carbohydrate kinase [Bosea sp. SSUT16]|uniref:FGGY-family carbohydrate kinase n=1 Tax=Bosea spartocytisi TaxID=2773451 RepID=A0A927I0C4_9HYPH|nr:FGGY-family carbohydrate kinase [Bosea spartocytisi]MBD3846192.1 FGGY-family carbohydrate kinase [Bosea spartocytisi]MCT4473376.1 FGGY-family carbohydrate kinase [Bosea spartocytisi]